MKEFKIALISHQYPPFSIGGIGTFTRDLALNLSKKEIPTTVFCGKYKTASIYNINKYLTIVGLPMYNIPPEHFWFQLLNINTLSRKLNEFSIIHGVNPMSSTICALFKKKVKKPLISSTHGFPYFDLINFIKAPISSWTMGEFIFNILEYPLSNWLIKSTILQSNHVITCSVSTKKELESIYKNFNSNISVIYNAVDLENINKLQNKCKEIANVDNTILFFGRLYYRKGIIHLLKALSIIKSHIPHIKLKIIGKGPLEKKIREVVRKLNIHDNVQLMGYVSNIQLAQEITKCRVVVLPSLYEAQPISVLEAMAYQKPVIAYDFPFAREYIKHFDNGLLSKPMDIPDLAEKTIQLLSNKKLCNFLGKNAYEYVKKNHNWDIQINKYIELYNDYIF